MFGKVEGRPALCPRPTPKFSQYRCIDIYSLEPGFLVYRLKIGFVSPPRGDETQETDSLETNV